MNIDLEQKIRERAYEIWEREGRTSGRDEEHWHAAKLELTSAPQDTSSIAMPARAAATTAEKAKKSRGRAAPVEPQAAVASSAPRRRRAPARPAQ